MNELAVLFQSNTKWLVGILHHPHSSTQPLNKGVIIVVGGPQTRVGSHRQFVLLARYLASCGITVFRFDYAGVGDSEGEPSDFLTAPVDIKAAIEQLESHCPELDEIVLWGLCDAASAILLYLSEQQSAKINRLILANPWVEQQQSKAKTVLRHYYLSKLFSRGLWSKVLRGKVDFGQTIRDLRITIKNILIKPDRNANTASAVEALNFTRDNFVQYMKQGLTNFNGSIHLILSGQDLVAKEFSQLIASDKEWQQLIKSKVVGKLNLDTANHTFSTAASRANVEQFTYKSVR